MIQSWDFFFFLVKINHGTLICQYMWVMLQTQISLMPLRYSLMKAPMVFHCSSFFSFLLLSPFSSPKTFTQVILSEHKLTHLKCYMSYYLILPLVWDIITFDSFMEVKETNYINKLYYMLNVIRWYIGKSIIWINEF